MRVHRILIAVLLPAVSSCYLQVEDSAVQVTHSLCTPSTSPCVPGAPGLPISAFNAAGGNTFTVSFGSVPLLQSTSSVGPATAHTNVALNTATFMMRTPGASFSGIQSVNLLHVPPGAPTTGDPCPATANCTPIASYDASTDGPADQQIVLRSQVANLLDLVDPVQHTLTIAVHATGVAPSQPWTADLVMNLGMKARVNLP